MTTASELATAVGVEASGELVDALTKIRHCVEQLSDEEIWRRERDDANSIGNLVLHLEGNLRQWIVAGFGAAEDRRDRPSEFAKREPIPREDLLARMESVVEEACQVLKRISPEDMLSVRRIQGFEVSGLAALFHSIPHFRGHTQEIVRLTRDALGERYRFHWRPTTPEQGAPSEVQGPGPT